MKKLFTFFLAVGSLTASSQSFTSGNLVVSRLGNGTETLSETSTSSVFLDEYNLSGTKVRSIALPTVTEFTDETQTVVKNRRFTSLGLFGYEGLLSLSGDGRFLTMGGYDADPGTSSLNGVRRVMALVNVGGTVNTGTSTTISGNPNPRSVVTNNGTGFWFAVGAANIRYMALGGTGVTTVSTQPTASRSIGIFNGQLYAATTVANLRMATIGTGMPITAGQSLTALPGTAATDANTNQFVMFDTDANNIPDLMYTANDGGASPGTATIRKYVLESGAWAPKGTLSSTGITEGLKGITGNITGNVVTLYAVTMGNTGTSTPSALLKIVDNDKGSDISTTIPVLTRLATAPAGTVFKGVAFAPKETVTPVRFGTFNGKIEGNAVRLNWNTFSEYNNSHFELLRSADGKTFVSVATLQGKGEKGNDYIYTDYNPYPGINYYQLKQVDKDGTFELLKTIAINVGAIAKTEKVAAYFSSEGIFNVNVNTSVAGQGHIVLNDLTGRKILNVPIILKEGSNAFSFHNIKMPSGIYVVNLKEKNTSTSIKFRKD